MATGQRQQQQQQQRQQQQQQQRQNDVVYPVMSASGPTRLDASTLKTATNANGNMMHRTHTVEIVHVGSGHGNTPPVARKGETSKVLCV
jgi:hypothetical protein